MLTEGQQIKFGIILNYIILGLKSLLGIVYVPYLLRMLGPSEYGIYSLCSSFVGYLTILDFGFSATIIRYSAKYRAENNQIEENRLFGFSLFFFCIISVIIFSIGFYAYEHLDILWEKNMTEYELSRAKIMAAFLFFNLGISFPLNVFAAIVTAYEKFIFQKCLLIFTTISSTITMIVLLNYGYKAVALVVVQTVTNILVLTSNLIYACKSLHIHLCFTGWRSDFIKEIFIFSFWLFLCSLLDQIYWNSGQVVLGCFYIPKVVALFAVASQIKAIYMNVSTAMVNLLLPKMTHLVSTGASDSEISAIFVKVGRIQYLILGFMLSSYIVLGRQFITLWAGKDYTESYCISMWLLVSLTIPLIQNLGITILQARNQLKFRSLCFASLSILCIILEVILSKYYGAVGCAAAIGISLFLGQGVAMNIYYYFYQKIDIVKFFSEIIKMSISPLVLIMCSMGVIKYFHLPLCNWISLAVASMCFSTIYFIVMFVTVMNAEEKRIFFNFLRNFHLLRG